MTCHRWRASYVTVANLKTEIFIFYFAEKKFYFLFDVFVFITILLCCVFLATGFYEKQSQRVGRCFGETQYSNQILVLKGAMCTIIRLKCSQNELQPSTECEEIAFLTCQRCLMYCVAELFTIFLSTTLYLKRREW